MKLYIAVAFLFWTTGSIIAQDNLDLLLAAGVDDSHTFTEDYLRPGTESLMYNLSSGWYQTAEVKGVFGFEFSIIGNATIKLDDHQSFLLNTADYENLEFADGATSKNVATILGQNDPDIEAFISYEDPLGGEQERVIILPQGLAAANAKLVPTAFLQGRLGIFKGTEIKARYFPKIDYEDAEAEIYGAALQHEFTSWLPASDVFPVAISGIVAYTKVKGDYDFTAQEVMEGSDQHLAMKMNSWLFSAIISTNIPVINFYGGLGYVKGTAESAMLGRYEIQDINGETIDTVEDPFVVSHEIGDIKANLGVSLKLAILRLHAEYNFQEYETVSIGLHLGI